MLNSFTVSGYSLIIFLLGNISFNSKSRVTWNSLVAQQVKDLASLSLCDIQWFCLISLFSCLFVYFVGAYPYHMEVPRLGVESELQLLAYATATSTWDPSRVSNLHHSSLRHQIPNPQIKVSDQTHILMDTSQIRFCCATMGTLV